MPKISPSSTFVGTDFAKSPVRVMESRELGWAAVSATRIVEVRA
jgi:hypothetical protein